MKLTAALAAAFLAVSVSSPAHSQPSQECKDLLQYLPVDYLQTQQWYASEAETAANEFLKTNDIGHLKSWIAVMNAYQTQMAQVTIPKIVEALNCVTESTAKPASHAPQTDGDQHQIPEPCGSQMAAKNFQPRFCPSPWIGISHPSFEEIYKQVWYCPENGPDAAYGVLLHSAAPGGCGSAFVPDSVRNMVRLSTGR